MTRSLVDKFHKHLPLLEQTVRRECDLDHSNPKLYKKVYRYLRDKGVEFYNKYIDNNPYSVSAWFNLGNLHHRVGKMKNAVTSYDFCIAIDKNYIRA